MSSIFGLLTNVNKRTASLDVYATYGSSVDLLNSNGSGASNALVSSPPVNTYALTNNGAGIYQNGTVNAGGGNGGFNQGNVLTPNLTVGGGAGGGGNPGASSSFP
jgi:hypothetical protein